MAYLLLDSIHRFGDLGDDTEILVYTSSGFKAEIEQSAWMSDRVRFEINDAYTDVTSACKARLDLFELESISRYEKVLYLDTDIIVKGSLKRAFDIVQEDLLYVLGCGEIDAPSEAFGRTLFGPEVVRHQDKTAFTSGMMAFRNSDRMRDFFAAVKKDIRDRPGDFHCHDQPYIVYNAFKYALFDNQRMKLVAANDCYDLDSDLVLHHFPGVQAPGEYTHKLIKMRRFLGDLRQKQLNVSRELTGESDRQSGVELERPMNRRMLRRATAKGEICLPAVPGMLEQYVELCDATFKTLGVHFTSGELEHLRDVLRTQLAEAYAASSRSDILVSYECPYGLTVNYHIKAQWFTVEGAYDNWVATREPPLFGTEPDARVWDLATAAIDPAGFRVLDIGAGTGRNSLALARRGHPVDAVEMTPKFAEILRAEAAREGLAVRVVERDVFATTADDLRTDYDLILLSEVVSDFRTREQVRGMFELAARCLAPGGQLVFNTFLARGGYVPDDAARELGQQCYTSIFTYPEIAVAVAGLPLERVADDSVYDYEKNHLPAEKWPPTSWYEGWVRGLDVFETTPELCPIELRWLVYRKVWTAAPTTGNASPSSW